MSVQGHSCKVKSDLEASRACWGESGRGGWGAGDGARGGRGGGTYARGWGGEVVELEGDGARRRAGLIPSKAMPDACKLAYSTVADLVTQLCERSLVIQQTSEVRR